MVEANGAEEGGRVGGVRLTERYAFIVEVKRKKSIGQKAICEIAARIAALPLGKTVSVSASLAYDGTLEAYVTATRAHGFLMPPEEILRI